MNSSSEKTKKRLKNLYKGIFNYSRGLDVLYAYAYSERQAFETMVRRLARDHDVSVAAVRGVFNGEKENYRIKIEMEVRESDGV